MTGTPDNNPGGNHEPQFSEEQINSVLDKLEQNPTLIEALISNAQSGNQEDLGFLMELGDRGIILGFDDGGGFIHRAQE